MPVKVAPSNCLADENRHELVHRNVINSMGARLAIAPAFMMMMRR